MNIDKIIAIFGMPRSGTSFVGQIFDSNPDVAFRMEPIFSYALKNQVNEHSNVTDFENFFQKALEARDDVFMNQLENRRKGIYPIFIKADQEKYLVIKTTRFHEILPQLLDLFSEDFLKIVSVVRHPCGAINSWLQHKNEFPANADPSVEWRTGLCRKTAKEEYWGFEDWLKVMASHTALEFHHKNFRIFQYENIVNDINGATQRLFDFAGIPITDQTKQFIKSCHSREDIDPYSVYKSKNVIHTWKKQLDKNIQKQIIQETGEKGLGRFIVS